MAPYPHLFSERNVQSLENGNSGICSVEEDIRAATISVHTPVAQNLYVPIDGCGKQRRYMHARPATVP